MKTQLWVIAIVLIGCQSTSRKEEPHATININNNVFKFDKLLAGDSLVATFVLTNKGSETARILKMGTSCDCTTVSYPDSILSSQTDTIFVKYKSKLIDTGFVERTVVLEMNTKKHFQELHLTGQVVLK